jgi:hypothetical protein
LSGSCDFLLECLRGLWLLADEEIIPHGKRNIGWQFQVALGWTAAVVMAAVTMVGPFHMSYRNYRYNREEAALYNALLPILWSSFLGWIVLALTSGYAGKRNGSISCSASHLGVISLLLWRKYQVKSFYTSKFKYYSDLRLCSVACNLICRLRGNTGSALIHRALLCSP